MTRQSSLEKEALRTSCLPPTLEDGAPSSRIEHKPRLTASARTHPGLVRDENQDRMTAVASTIGRIYIVADGMGGHQDGGMAAEVVVRRLEESLGHASDPDVEAALVEAFSAANAAVHQKARHGDAHRPSMGSTAVVAVFSGNRLWVGHVGDSRAYRYRAAHLEQLTRDHTLVQRMLDAGMLSPEAARDHPDASVLDRALGTLPTVEPEIQRFDLEEGDAILLCSDGLTSFSSKGEIEEAIANAPDDHRIADAVVDLALEKGAPDNVTVQFVRYSGTGALAPGVWRPPVHERTLWHWIAISVALLLLAVLALLLGINVLRSSPTARAGMVDSTGLDARAPVPELEEAKAEQTHPIVTHTEGPHAEGR